MFNNEKIIWSLNNFEIKGKLEYKLLLMAIHTPNQYYDKDKQWHIINVMNAAKYRYSIDILIYIYRY